MDNKWRHDEKVPGTWDMVLQKYAKNLMERHASQ